MDQQKVIALFKGQSGCCVELIERDGALRVRKSSRDPKTIERLKNQYQKMKKLKGMKSVYVPDLLDAASDTGRFCYEMHYCELARPFADAVEEMSLYELRNVVDFLIDLLSELGSVVSLEKSPKFGEANALKLTELLNDEAIQRHSEITASLENILSRHDAYFAPIANMEGRFCHGDLTMDNILYDREGRRWLIDPSDSFFEHPWTDIAKLYQDIEGEWFRIRNRAHQRRASSNLWRWGAIVKEWISQTHPLYLQYHYYLLGLNFVRILPYAAQADVRLNEAVREKTSIFLKRFIEGKRL